MRLRQLPRLFFAALFLTFALSGAAVAAPAAKAAPVQTGHATEAKTEAEGEHKKGGLPQFDVSRFPSQIFWLVIAFGLTYALMRYVALPGVQKTLETRASRIEADVAAARQMNEEAKKLAADYETRLKSARAEAQEIHRIAGEEQARRSSTILAEQQTSLSKGLKDAEDRINKLRAEALSTIEQEAVGVVGELVKRLAGMNVDNAALQTAVKNVKGA